MTRYRAGAEGSDAVPRRDRPGHAEGFAGTGLPHSLSALTDDQSALGRLGLDAATEELYRLMLARPTKDISWLAARLSLADAQVRRMLARLRELSLVTSFEHTVSGFRAVPLEIATDLLIARRHARIAADLATIERCRAEQFAAKRAAGEPGKRRVDSTRLVGKDAIRERLTYLTNNARTEVMRFAGPPAHADPTAFREPHEKLLQRGVRIRTVYQDSIRDQPLAWAHANWLRGVGGEVRVTGTLPTRMIIFDRRQAVVPIDPDDLCAGAMLVLASAVVSVLTALFEPIWSDAAPIGPAKGAPEGELSHQERAVLRLLAAGLTDEAVAKRIGCSARTARRIAAQLMARLDAQSRFQAGVRAVAKGWLHPGAGRRSDEPAGERA
jgi:DNA-binding CsgD family transcriptional regulator